MTHKLSVIYSKITSAITGALTLDDIYEPLLLQILDFTNTENGSITLYNRAEDQVDFKAQVHENHIVQSHKRPNKPPIYEQIIKHVTNHNETLNLADLTQDSRWSDCPDKGTPRALLSVPIVVEERVFGAIMLEGKKLTPFRVNEEQQQLIFAGEQLALAIETYTLRDIGSQLAALSAKKVLPTIIKTACQLFAASASAISLKESRTGENLRNVRYDGKIKNITRRPTPGGLTYTIANSGKHHDIRDVQNKTWIKPITKKRGMNTIFGTPLQVIRQDEDNPEVLNIGTLFVELQEDRSSTSREKRILGHLARQATQVIEDRYHAHTLDLLNEISAEISSEEQDIPTLAKIILNHAVKLVDADGGRLCLLDETGKAIQIAFMKNPSKEIVSIRMKEISGVLKRVVETQKPFAKSDYHLWDERNTDFDDQDFTAVAGVPILYHERLWGVIMIHDTKPGKVFDDSSLDILTNLANLASVAFSNASRLDDFARLIESAYVSVIAVDNDGKITQFNQRAQALLHYTKEEAIGLPITDIYYYVEHARELMRLMLEDNNEGRARDFETFLKSKKGDKIPIKISTSLLYDYKGKRSGSIGFFQDQRRKKARNAITRLLVKDEVFQAIADQALHLTGASHSAHLALNIDDKLEVKAAHPPERFAGEEIERSPVDLRATEKIGISGRAFKKGKSQSVPNVAEDPDYICYDPETNSELAVPIIDQQERVLGVIDVQHPDIGAFSEVEQNNLESLSSFAAMAIHNAELYHKSSVEKRRLETVAAIIRDTARSLPINSLLRNTCRRLEKVFTKQKAVVSIRLYEAEEQILRFEPEWHENFHRKLANQAQTTQSIEEGICGWVAQNRCSKNVGNVKKDDHFIPLVPGTCSELTVPIQLSESDELIGVLDLQSPQCHAFSQSDLEFLEVLANQLATDIRSGQQARQANAEQAIRQIQRAANQPEDLLSILAEIVFQIYRLDRDGEKQINSVVLREKRGSKLRLVVAEPISVQTDLQEHLLEKDLNDKEGRIGVSGRAALLGVPQLVTDVSADPDYRTLHDNTQSELAIPVKIANQVVAVVDIESAKLAAFNQEDLQIYESLAAQVGIALNLFHQLRDSKRNNDHLEALYRASRIVKQGEVGSLNAWLQDILKLAVEYIQSENGSKAQMSVIQLYDSEKNTLKRASIYPPDSYQEWKEKLGEERSLERRLGYKIGIHGRAILDRETQLINDVRDDPDYMGLSDKTLSELDVLLIDEEENVLGVLGLESEELDIFDEQDQKALEGLAEMAVIAIRNFQQYQKLKESNEALADTQAQMAARTAIALLGTERGTWRHKFVGHVGSIETIVRLLRRDIKAGESPEKFEERLDRIEQVIAKTRTQKIIKLKEKYEAGLDSFMEQWWNKFYWDPELIEEGQYTCHFNCPDVSVTINEYWFNMVIENVVNNALRAMKDQIDRQLTIETSLNGEWAEIVIQDNGPGIPEDIRQQMFKGFILKDDKAEGEGIGLILSGIIVEESGGKIEAHNLPTGASIIIRLPYQLDSTPG